MNSASGFILSENRQSSTQQHSDSCPGSHDLRLIKSDQQSGTSNNYLAPAVGISLSGGYIFNALATQERDAVEDDADEVDTCLAHPTA